MEGDGIGFATESYAASALYTTLASLSGALRRIRRASTLDEAFADSLMRVWIKTYRASGGGQEYRRLFGDRLFRPPGETPREQPPSILRSRTRRVATTPRPSDGLRTPAEAAARLGCSIKTLNGHVAAGALKYVIIGHGTKRPRKMFTDADLDPIHHQSDPRGPAVSVRRDPRSPYWQFDFQIGGHRFFGSTKATNRREAEAVERAEREKAKRQIERARAAATSLRLDDVAGRYWQEVGQYHAGAGASNTERLIRLPDRAFRQGQADHRHYRRRRDQARSMAARASGTRRPGH